MKAKEEDQMDQSGQPDRDCSFIGRFRAEFSTEEEKQAFDVFGKVVDSFKWYPVGEGGQAATDRASIDFCDMARAIEVDRSAVRGWFFGGEVDAGDADTDAGPVISVNGALYVGTAAAADSMTMT